MMRVEPQIPPTLDPSRGDIVAPTRSYEVNFQETGLLILTGLWKTPARISRVFHSPLDGANGCAAHKDQQALLLASLLQKKGGRTHQLRSTDE